MNNEAGSLINFSRCSLGSDRAAGLNEITECDPAWKD